jgi:putative solute:sodium symporter small subunit
LGVFIAQNPDGMAGQAAAGVASCEKPRRLRGPIAMESPDVVYWEKTRRLMIISLSIWAFFSFVIHFFVNPLNEIVILGFPLGFYMAAQGSLIAFVVLIFWYAYAQHKIDVECGVEETAEDAGQD